MLNLFEELKAVIGAFEASGVGYAVCGGISMAIHGFPRATRDIDMLVREEDVPRIQALVDGIGFNLTASPMVFKGGAVVIHRITKILPDDYTMLDLLSVTPAIENVWASRQRMNWEHGQLWVVSREGLVQLKTLSGRHQDLADIERLQQGEE